jgi:hypothetical protein
LASGELGWSIDTRRLYIGNGTLDEGAPTLGRTEILTEVSLFTVTGDLAANIEILQGNVTVLEGNITTINSQIASLQAASTSSTPASLPSSSSGTITSTTANNAIISYTLTQGSKQRTGSIKLARYNSTVAYDEEYDETATTDVVFTIDANSTQANLKYTTTTGTDMLYRITTLN